jgi:D-threo-aldose 1-dehydrogenase
MISLSQRRPLGLTGLNVPPIVFGTTALANVPRVIPEQRKLAICGEWLRNVEPPMLVDVAYDDGDGMSLEVLSRMLRHLDVSASEVVVHLTLGSNQLADYWEKSCRLLGDDYRPKLLSVRDADDGTIRTLSELKASRTVQGVGVATNELREFKLLTPPIDWVVLSRGFSLIRHADEMLSGMTAITEQKVPIVVRGVFGGGFLIGGNCLDGSVLSSDDQANRRLFAWRTAFAALCHGHGITPAHACIQFALSAPGVVAVELNTSYPDRVAENSESATRKIPDAFWASMKEEGLMSAE